MEKEYINPKELFPGLQYGFSQIVTSTGGKTVFLSGQVGWNEKQVMVGPDDLRTQTWQTVRNIETAMKAAGGRLTDVVSMRIYVVEERLEESHHIQEALKEFFSQDRAPTTTWIGVRALANKEFLIEPGSFGASLSLYFWSASAVVEGQPRPGLTSWPARSRTRSTPSCIGRRGYA